MQVSAEEREEEGLTDGSRIRVCALDGCDRRFTPASNRQKFCTPAHQQQAQAMRRRPVDPELPIVELEQIRDDALATVVPAAEALTQQLTALLERLSTINESAVARIGAAEAATAEARAAQQEAAEATADAIAARERAERQSRIDRDARAAAETEASAATRQAEASREAQHRAEVAQAESERDARWLAEQLADLRQQHSELRHQHGELRQQHSDLESRHEQLQAQHGTLAEAQAELLRARDADRAAHLQQVHDLELRHRDQLTEHQQAHARDLAEAERRHTADREHLAQRHRDEIQSHRDDARRHRDESERLIQRHRDEAEHLRAEHTAALARLTELDQSRAEQATRLSEQEHTIRTIARDYAALFDVATELAAADETRNARAELAAVLKGRTPPPATA